MLYFNDTFRKATHALLKCPRLKDIQRSRFWPPFRFSSAIFPTWIRNHSHYSGTKAQQFINWFHLTQPGHIKPLICSRQRLSRSEGLPEFPHLICGWMWQLPSTRFSSKKLFLRRTSNICQALFFPTFPSHKNSCVMDSTGGLTSLPRLSVRSGLHFGPICELDTENVGITNRFSLRLGQGLGPGMLLLWLK